MKPIEKTFYDKSVWGDGPWIGEPDKIQWIDEVTGLDCLMVRNYHDGGGGGHWCGYVGVPEGHPAYEHDYQSLDVEVHGGLTFAEFCRDSEDERGICHVPQQGRPDKVWWLGFDCAHGGDFMPGYYARTKELDLCASWPARLATWRFTKSFAPDRNIYKDVAYVKRQVANLAGQLAQMVTHDPA